MKAGKDHEGLKPPPCLRLHTETIAWHGFLNSRLGLPRHSPTPWHADNFVKLVDDAIVYISRGGCTKNDQHLQL